jgi:hypothetical protein
LRVVSCLRTSDFLKGSDPVTTQRNGELNPCLGIQASSGHVAPPFGSLSCTLTFTSHLRPWQEPGLNVDG